MAGKGSPRCPEQPVSPTAGQLPFSESSPHPKALAPGVPKPPPLFSAQTPLPYSTSTALWPDLSMFTAALSIFTPNWKQPGCLSVGDG